MTPTKGEITPHDPQFGSIKRHDLESYLTFTHIGDQESSFTHTMPATGLYGDTSHPGQQVAISSLHLYFNDRETEAH